MGTSSSYTAPTSGNWPKTKRLATLFARQMSQGSGAIAVGQVTGAYAQAMGGGEAAAAGAVAGRAAASSLAGFLSSVVTGGLSNALQQAGLLTLRGRDTIDVLEGLVDYLAGPGKTLEESVARAAMAEVLINEFGEAETYAELDALCTQQLDAAGMLQVLQHFVVEYVYLRIVEAIGERLQNGAMTSADARRCETDIHEFIVATVDLDFTLVDPLTVDWNGPAGQKIVERLVAEAHDQLG